MRSRVRSALAAVGAFAVVAGLATLAPPASAAVSGAFYVDCSAATGGDGSATAPWNSLGGPNGHVFGPGDTLSLRAGTTCAGTLAPQGSGAEGAPITLGAYGSGPAPVVDGNGAPYAVHLTDQSHWTIRDLRVTNPAPTRAQRTGIQVDSLSAARKAGIVITGNEVYDTAGWGDKTGSQASWYVYSAGIMIRHASGTAGPFDGITVTDNQVHDTGGGAIKISGDGAARSTAVRIAGNTVREAGGDGIVVHNAVAPLVEHNTALDLGLGHYPFVAGNFAGMWPYNSHDPTFQFNVVGRSRPSTFDSTAWDCDIATTGTCLFQYNYSFGNAGGWYLNCLGNCGGSTATDAVLRYNVSQDDCRMVVTTGGTGITHIYNNTFICPSRPVEDTIGANKRVTNNVFVAPGGSFATGTGVTYDSNAYFGGIAPAPGDSRAITSDPRLVAPGSGGESLADVTGYRLRTGSPALGSGAVVAGNGGRDFFGNPVSATAGPNRGAYNGPGIAPGALPLTASYNQVGVTADANPSAGGLSSGTNSGRSFSAEALAAAGLGTGRQVTADGVTLTFHRGAPGTPDHVVAAGQTVQVTGTGSKLGFLGFSTSHAPAGTGTLRFRDGTTQTFTLALTDWWDTSPAAGNVLVARATYQNQHASPYNGSTTRYAHTASVWAGTIALPAGKTLDSVTLPQGGITSGTALRIFDMAVGG
ncbi:right-handed parallel beta-helix repeat-containing protein [Streptomyces sp. NPDC053431]|uniref:right-handed parallel beta-helix repeat-containing protein n=1 Tax=Streptomyces sp. NPDC053431 TaxID=3365703 RepID=UPI0037CD70D9